MPIQVMWGCTLWQPSTVKDRDAEAVMVVHLHEATLPELGTRDGRIPALLDCKNGCGSAFPLAPINLHPQASPATQKSGYHSSAGDAVGPSASPHTHPRRRCGDSAKGDEWHGVGGGGMDGRFCNALGVGGGSTRGERQQQVM